MSQQIACQGFKVAAIAAGIKKRGGLDMGLIFSEVPARVAGMFTRNRVKAAPVVLSHQRVAGGRAQAVVVNAGNANCCTGAQGDADALAMGSLTAENLHIPEEMVLVASTGVIGQPMPMTKVTAAVPELAKGLDYSGFDAFSKAIMTTDTVPKLIVRTGRMGNQPFTIVAAAKGAGMIRPDMATMLCFICSDLDAPPDVLQRMLKTAVDQSLNTITIDGDTSTNDTVLLLANGMSGVCIENREQEDEVQTLLNDLLLEMAHRLVRDGEGVTKVVEVRVHGAPSDADALRVADTICHSPLVKTAFFGEDANWGRILAAAGRSGVPIEPGDVSIYFDDEQMVAAGMGLGADAEARVTAIMKRPEFSVSVDLGRGNGRATMLTCDFSLDYVKINADYRS